MKQMKISEFFNTFLFCFFWGGWFICFSLSLIFLLRPLHPSTFDLMCWQALRGKDTRCPYSVTFPLLAFTGPNICLQTPAAQPINHCRVTQYNRKFAQGAQLGHYQCPAPIYFASALFSVTKLMCHSPKAETVDCDVVRRNNGSNRRVERILIWGFFLFIHRLLLLTSRESVHNYAHACSFFVPRDLLSCNFGEEVTL